MFERGFECLGENTENYKKFSVTIKKEVKKIEKDFNESVLSLHFTK